MANLLGDWTRTHSCGALRANDAGRDVTLLGWVHRVRDLGSLVFIDLRDREGLTQVVVREGSPLLPAAKQLAGRMRRRRAGGGARPGRPRPSTRACRPVRLRLTRANSAY